MDKSHGPGVSTGKGSGWHANPSGSDLSPPFHPHMYVGCAVLGWLESGQASVWLPEELSRSQKCWANGISCLCKVMGTNMAKKEK